MTDDLASCRQLFVGDVVVACSDSSVPGIIVDRMRRAYVAANEPFDRAMALALRWAGATATIHAPDTASVEENDLDGYGIPVTSASRKSRFSHRPHGTVIGAFLNLDEVLDVERNARVRGSLSATVDGLIVLGAYGPYPYAETGLHHSAWITAFDVEHLGGEFIAPVAPAPAPLRAAIYDLSTFIVRNQGLLDKDRERSEAVHALTYLRGVGFPLDPDALMVEALCNEWGSTGPEDLRQIAIDLNKGTNLQYKKGRVSQERLRGWAAAAAAG
jgi:hypothetical protein